MNADTKTILGSAKAPKQHRKQLHEPENFYRLARIPKDCRRKADRPDMIEVQGWGIDAAGNCICAGVHWVQSVSARWAWKIGHNHRRWRKWYDSRPWNLQSDYPAKHDSAVAVYGIHPVDSPKDIVWARL